MIERYVSAAELRRLVSALIVVLGFIAITMFFAFLIVPGQRYQARTADESSVVAVQGESGWLDPTDYLPARRVEIPPIDPATVMTATPELLAKGKALYGQTCATCHGSSGHGDGAGGKGLTPAPRSFVAASGWKNGYRLEDIFGTLERGIPGSAMVSYNYLRKQDRMALAHFVQHLGTFDHGQSDPKARALLEQRFSSQGEVIPNRIPVRDAMQHLVAEYQPNRTTNTCREIPNIGDAIAVPERAARSRPSVDIREMTEFAKVITAGVPYNGIAVEVSTFTYNQWNQLRLCLETR